jgi:hypothetical protein
MNHIVPFLSVPGQYTYVSDEGEEALVIWTDDHLELGHGRTSFRA